MTYCTDNFFFKYYNIYLLNSGGYLVHFWVK